MPLPKTARWRHAKWLAAFVLGALTLLALAISLPSISGKISSAVTPRAALSARVTDPHLNWALDASAASHSLPPGYQHWGKLENVNASNHDLRTLVGIDALRSVTELDLSMNSQLKDGAPLSTLTTLKKLNLMGTQIGDLRFVSALPLLEELNVMYIPTLDPVTLIPPAGSPPRQQPLDIYFEKPERGKFASLSVEQKQTLLDANIRLIWPY